jgi:hypothetical protein
MQTLPKPRLRRLNIRLSQQEWDKVKSLSSNTTCRNVSEYARLLLLDKPVRIFDRNSSFDDFEQLMTRLLAELDDFGDRFDQATRKTEVPDADAILLLLESFHENYTRKTKEIKEVLTKTFPLVPDNL